MSVNIFQQQKPVAHIGRNGFDKSQDTAFSVRAAIARPVSVIDTVPNSSFRINAANIVRTTALQNAAFLRGKQELDFFFVPYSQLYSAANKVILTRGDNLSPALNISDSAFPLVDKELLLEYAVYPYLMYRLFIFANSDSEVDWSEGFFTNVMCALTNAYVGNASTSDTWLIFSKLCLYDNVSYADCANCDPTLLHWVQDDVLALVAECGYGDYFLQVKHLIDSVLANHFEQPVSNPVSAVAPIKTLIDALFAQGGDREQVNLLHLAAYQKVWNDHYRDSINDDNSLYDYSSSLDSFNPISLFDLASNPSLINTSRNIGLTYLRPRRRMYERDLSVGLYSSTQFGAAGRSGSVNLPELKSIAPDSAALYSTSPTQSAYAIKFAFAMQKYREMLMRAGSRTKDVLNAEFGVKSHFVDDHYSRYLGSFQGSLDVNKVEATADTDGMSVGDIAGNVFSSLQGNTIEFTCNDYGIIIGVLTFLAKPLHNAFGIDPFVIKQNTYDFYHEAFANMGLKPVSSKLFSNVSSMDGSFSPFTIGFAACDFEYKQKLDMVFGSFCTAPILPDAVRQAWATLPYQTSLQQPSNGANSNYVLVRPVRQTMSLLKERVYQMPDIFDTVFKQQDTGGDGLHHFDVALSVNVSSVQPMPVMGMF